MKVLSTTSLTKLIELIKSSFLSADNIVTTQTISCPADSEVVHNTGDETIAGIKTFSSSPVLPTPASSDNSTNAATTAFVKAQGYTSNTGTITGITMNNINKGTSGVINLGTVATSDTKTTAGASSDSSNKLYIIGSQYQSSYETTYTKDNCYMDSNGYICSTTPQTSDNSTKVTTTAYINAKFQVVNSLPSSPDSNTFYFIPE